MSKISQRIKLIFVPNENNEFQPPALREKSLLFYAVCLLILKIAILVFIFYFPKTDFFSAINVNNLVALINQERTNKNLPPLDVDPQLNQAAYLKAQDMINKDYFEHTSPSGVTPWYWFKKVGYNFTWAGENLAMHFTDTKTVFNAWMASPSHRDNILNSNFKDVGVAVASGKIGETATTISVLEFGSPRTSQDIAQKPALSPTPKVSSPTPSPTKTNVKAQETTPPASPKPSPSAKETPSATPEPQKIAFEGPVNLSQAPIVQLSTVGKVLGTATSNLMELAKNIYLYFSLFLIIALAINILVKIRIQYVPTIVLTLILIGISVGMIFI